MRTHPFNLIAALVGMSALQGTAMLSPAIAGPAPNCTGEACEALKVSADGCLWTNATDKAVRFSLSEGATTIVSTVLAPGGNFREANKDACVTNKPESPQYQATFASLRQMPDAPDFTLKPKATAMARAVMPKPAIALPRAKPQAASIAMVSPPLPRAKPDTTAVPSAPPSTKSSSGGDLGLFEEEQHSRIGAMQRDARHQLKKFSARPAKDVHQTLF